MLPTFRYSKYKGLRQVTLTKGDTGLGIMIIEGKHPDAGTGVFISDLQDGSVADTAGLLVGDMILSVNGEDFVGASYETAAKVLKKLDGEIKIIVANPNLPPPALPGAAASSAQQQEAVASGQQQAAGITTGPAAKSESPQKPKIAPKPNIAPKPANLGRDLILDAK